MKIAILCIAFVLVLANDVDSRKREDPQEILNNNKNVEYNNDFYDLYDHKDLPESENGNKGEEDDDNADPADISDNLSEEPQEILNDNVEYNSEDQHKDLFENENGNEGSVEEGEDLAGSVGLTEVEINAMNNFEGDEMIISEEDKKRGVGTQRRLWPRVNGKLKIPYIFSSNLGNRAGVMRYIAVMNNHLRKCNSDSSDVWVKRTTQPHYIRFQNARGCYSYLGYIRRPNQAIGLALGCTRSATVLHEMLHAMGFSHEQSRSDRDKYVQIITNNIISTTIRNFAKLSSMRPESANTKYDYGSVMHYPRVAFAINRRLPTIVPINPRSAVIGQRIRMSPTDIAEVNSVYKCAAPVTTPTPPTTTTPPTTSCNTLLECTYNRGRCPYFAYYRWSLTSGYLKTKTGNAYSYAKVYKSRYPKILALNKCPCTRTGYCYKRKFCVQFSYMYTNPTRNIRYNMIRVFGYSYQKHGRRIRRFLSSRKYALGGSGWKTMRTTIRINCGQYIGFYVRAAPKQRYEVKMDNFIIKYGRC